MNRNELACCLPACLLALLCFALLRFELKKNKNDNENASPNAASEFSVASFRNPPGYFVSFARSFRSNSSSALFVQSAHPSIHPSSRLPTHQPIPCLSLAAALRPAYLPAWPAGGPIQTQAANLKPAFPFAPLLNQDSPLHLLSSRPTHIA